MKITNVKILSKKNMRDINHPNNCYFILFDDVINDIVKIILRTSIQAYLYNILHFKVKIQTKTIFFYNTINEILEAKGSIIIHSYLCFKNTSSQKFIYYIQIQISNLKRVLLHYINK